tara:strand:+ start:919 stop:1491 length:573 start_codon:yes stop_codon:yes gene_type:complete
MLFITDCSIADANKHIESWHRHSGPVPRIQTRFAYQLIELLPALKYSTTVGVAIIGNPCGRPNDPNIIELRRVAFKPDENFGHYRRWYPVPCSKPDISLRLIPIVVRTPDCYDIGTIHPRQIPSVFVNIGTALVKNRLPKMHTIWTYTHETEKGAYLEKAGYECDHRFTRRGIAKRRYRISLTERKKNAA